jgi:predicted transporter
MDINIILWIGGMLFTLSIFAVKVGFGLGGMRWKGIFLALVSYLVLFIFVAMFSEQLMKLLEPVLRKGPYLHALMAIGMIIWGILLLRNLEHSHSTTHIPHSILLLIPCPVCFTAMTFSTWAVLNVIKLLPGAPAAYLVGLGLGIVFCFLSISFCFILKFVGRNASPRIGISFGMLGIGLYFLAALVIPAKIEEAKGIYKSFLTDNSGIDMNNLLGVGGILFIGLLIGYFGRRNAVCRWQKHLNPNPRRPPSGYPESRIPKLEVSQ